MDLVGRPDTRGQKKFSTAADKVAAQRPNPVQESPIKNFRRPCLSSGSDIALLCDIQMIQHPIFRYHLFLTLLISYNPTKFPGRYENSFQSRQITKPLISYHNVIHNTLSHSNYCALSKFGCEKLRVKTWRPKRRQIESIGNYGCV